MGSTWAQHGLDARAALALCYDGAPFFLIDRSMPDRDTDGLPRPRRYFAVLAMSFGLALIVIDGSIISVALPTIARDLGVAPSAAVSIVTIYQLVLVMTLLPFSALGTRIGLRRLYQYGQTIFCIASALCFFAKSLPFLLVTRAAQALGAAAALSVTSALVRSIYPSNRLGRGLAFNNVVVSTSAAFAPVLGGLVLSFATWPWIFAVTVPFALLSIVTGRASLPDPVPHDEPYDVMAAVLCALTFGLVISGLESAVHGDSPIVSLAVVAAGVGIGYVFVRRELQEKEPILPVDLLAIPATRLSIIGALFAFIASVTLLLSMPFRLQHQFGFSPSEIGAVIAPWPLGMMALGPLAGILSDRIQVRILGTVGMAIATIGLLLLAFLPADAEYIDMAWRMALAGSGFGLFLAPNSRFIVGSAPATRVASAGGMISTTRLTGQTLGATIVAALLAANFGSDRTPALIAAALTLIAGLCSVARVKRATSKTTIESETDSL
jgi:DHA2 family multidrug resistance protein-like MFS transporter